MPLSDPRIFRRRVEQVVSSLVANALKFGARQPVEVLVETVGLHVLRE